jgi:hypothetical protein
MGKSRMLVKLRHIVLTLAAATLSCCSPTEPAQYAEARAELSKMFPELSADSLKLRNVQRVGGSVCGEVSIEANERPPIFRLFTYRPGKDAAIDLPQGPQLRANGEQCPVRDDILAICAATPSEREQAELRGLRCWSSGDI